MSHRRRRSRRRPHLERAPRAPVVPAGLPGGQYRPLLESDVRRIHEAALEVLGQVGIAVQPSRCRDLFERAGARVDAGANRVFLPRALVEDALATAKKLKEQGISDFLVLNEAGKRNALSLGVYGLRQNAELVKSRAESMNYAVKTEGRYREGRVFWLHGEQSGAGESLNLLSAEDTQAGVRYAPRACGMKEDT